MTNSELINAIQATGDVWLPVLGKNVVVHARAYKKDFLAMLNDYEPTDSASWSYLKDRHGDHWLDVAD